MNHGSIYINEEKEDDEEKEEKEKQKEEEGKSEEEEENTETNCSTLVLSRYASSYASSYTSLDICVIDTPVNFFETGSAIIRHSETMMGVDEGRKLGSLLVGREQIAKPFIFNEAS